jgi:hypothetical protein
VRARFYDPQHNAETTGEVWPLHGGQGALESLKTRKGARNVN